MREARGETDVAASRRAGTQALASPANARIGSDRLVTAEGEKEES